MTERKVRESENSSFFEEILCCFDVKLFSLHWVQEDSVVGMTLEHTMQEVLERMTNKYYTYFGSLAYCKHS